MSDPANLSRQPVRTTVAVPINYGHRALTLDRIVTETLALVDEQGIAGASMRAVGERLGVQAMSLYRYVTSREELFDAVADRIVDELATNCEQMEPSDSDDWRQYLSTLAWGVRGYACTHPRAFPLVATRPPDAPWVNPPLRSLRWIETLLRTLGAAGFSDEQVLFAYRTFNSFLLGYLLLETSAMVIDDPRPGDGSFQRGDGRADKDDDDVDARSYPVIHRLRDGLTDDRFEEEFAAGLEILLARIAARVDRPLT